MRQSDTDVHRQWYESDGTAPFRPDRRPYLPPSRTAWDEQHATPAWVAPGGDPTLAPYRFDVEPSRPRYLAGRLVVKLGAGGWIVTFVLAAAASGIMDAPLSGLWVVLIPLLFVTLIVMTFAGVLMSIAMIIAILMDFGVSVRRRFDAGPDEAEAGRRSRAFGPDSSRRETDTWQG
ncbi:MAG TPA: hypothetical protein VGT61_06650 [Thermomicrobiales bacterium]|jgi:uncharacterized membrane protein YhdT|nr:hypothetical protein [Thermomicrobiales bacterium]